MQKTIYLQYMFSYFDNVVMLEVCVSDVLVKCWRYVRDVFLFGGHVLVMFELCFSDAWMMIG